MRTNLAFILLLFILLSAFTFNSPLNLDAPSMKIETKDKYYKPGEIVYYTINLCSSEYLEYFEVLPEIVGCNKDSKVNLCFDRESKVATINYFYVIPENLKDVEEINISFIIRDKRSNKKIDKMILIK